MKGSELCKAMLKRGDKLVACKFGDYGDDVTEKSGTITLIKSFTSPCFRNYVGSLFKSAVPVCLATGKTLTHEDVGIVIPSEEKNVEVEFRPCSLWVTKSGGYFTYDDVNGDEYVLRNIVFGEFKGYEYINLLAKDLLNVVKPAVISKIVPVDSVWYDEFGDNKISVVGVKSKDNILLEIVVDVILYGKKVNTPIKISPNYFINSFKRVKNT